MKRYLTLAVWLACSCATAADLQGFVSGASSGDCLKVVAGGKEMPVPLEGVTCAPPSTKEGKTVLEAVKGLMVGQRVTVRGGDMFFDGDKSLVHSLIHSGLGKASGEDKDHSIIEQAAREAGRGLWRPKEAPKPAPTPEAKEEPVKPKVDPTWIAPKYDARGMMASIKDDREARTISELKSQYREFVATPVPVVHSDRKPTKAKNIYAGDDSFLMQHMEQREKSIQDSRDNYNRYYLQSISHSLVGIELNLRH